MNARDLVSVSFENLRRSKLRTALTIAGVVIAVATFTAMLSFAAGNQRYFTTAFREFGLLSTMTVTPFRDAPADASAPRVLNEEAVRALAAIPGVRLAYPYSTFAVTAAVRDTAVASTARAIPLTALSTKLQNRVLGGAVFSADSAREAIVTHEFVESVAAEPESLLGRPLVISLKAASLDSAFAASFDAPVLEAGRLFERVDLDSVLDPGYRGRFVRHELSERSRRFFDGFMNRQETVAETLVIVGVAPEDRAHPFQTTPIVIPEGVAVSLASRGMIVDGNMADLLAALRDGRLFEPEGGGGRSFPRVTLELEPLVDPAVVRDSVEALGYRGFSFAEQFREMQRFMVYFYAGLGVVGLIALVTAALGIINTLVMSVSERRREIGILKSLGADEDDIHRLFLMESAAIGAIGSVIGIGCGWVGTRIVAAVGKVIMEREGMPVFDPFALPVWLVLGALLLGVAVSVAAGLFPAARAAAVDPVEALRGE